MQTQTRKPAAASNALPSPSPPLPRRRSKPTTNSCLPSSAATDASDPIKILTSNKDPPLPPSLQAVPAADHNHYHVKSRSPSFMSRCGDGDEDVDNYAAVAGNGSPVELASWSSKQAKIWPAGCSSSGGSGCSEQELPINSNPQKAMRRDSSSAVAKNGTGGYGGDAVYAAFAAGDECRHGGSSIALAMAAAAAEKRGLTHTSINSSNGGTWRREGRASAALMNRGSRRGFQVIELQSRPRIVQTRHRQQTAAESGPGSRQTHREHHAMSASEQLIHLPHHHHHHHHHLQSYLHDRRRRRRPSFAVSHSTLLHSRDDHVLIPSNKHHLHSGDPIRADPALMVPSSTGNCFCVPRRGRGSSAARRAGRVAGYGVCNSERSFSPFDSDAETAPLMTEPEPYNDASDGGQTASSSMDMRALQNLQMVRGGGDEGGGEEEASPIARRKEGCRRSRRRAGGGEAMAGRRSLSQKYRPRVLKEMMGQAMVAESLQNAILREKIAPVYLFHGPRGTGKTTAARIFTSAMNCLSAEELRPCGVCSECSAFSNGHNYDYKEIDAAMNNSIESIRCLLKHISLPPSTSRFKVFVVDSCDALSSESWNVLLKSLEEPPGYVVFILITSDPELLPRTALSRCQKFIFPRIKDADIAFRLRRLAAEEGIDIDADALQFIANRADGSFRDAENMLDQLSLLGTKITLATVQDMVGLIPDEKLSNLLELALSGDAGSTVHAIRELIESGVEPLALTSQLANLITDILAGKTRGQTTYSPSAELTKQQEEERLKQALRILSESEKQLRSCSDRTTWLTAAFLQFTHNSEPSLSRENSVRRSPANFVVNREAPSELQGTVQKNPSARPTDEKCPVSKSPPLLQTAEVHKQLNSLPVHSHPSECRSPVSAKHSAVVTKPGAVGFGNVAQRSGSRVMSPSTMKNIWNDVIQSVCLDAVKQLLLEQGRLVSLSVTEASAIARISFRHPDHKTMAEEARANIANAFQLVLGFPTEVEIRFDKMHRDPHRSHGEKMGQLAYLDEFGCGNVGPVDDSNYSSGLEDFADRGGSNLLCWNNARRRSKGKHMRRRRRGKFLLRLVPCAKGGRVT